MSRKVLVTGNSVAEQFLTPLTEAGLVIENPPGVLSEEELSAALSDAEAYLFGGDEYASGSALRDAKRLKIVAFLGVGYESFVDTPVATELRIPVTNTPGTLTQSVAEFTVGQLLNATRRLATYGTFATDPDAPAEEKRHDLGALRVGILGLGAIGTRIAEMLRFGIGANVVYWSRTRKPDEEQRLGIEYRDFDSLLAEVDALVVMTPGTKATHHLIGASQLDRLRPGAILINTARADVVDPGALLNALSTGHLDTAVFDGFYEPAEKYTAELMAHVGGPLILTRHIASLTHEARDGMAIKAVQSILNVLSSGEDENIVNL